MKDQRLKIKDTNQRLNIILKYKHFLFFICIFAFLYLIYNIDAASASSSSSKNYNIQIQDIDTVQKKSVPAKQTPDTEITLPDQETEVSRDTAPISFSASSSLVDFGPLSPNNPALRTVTLSILTTNSDYSLQVFEDHPLSLKPQEGKSQSGEAIPDTTCDNGACSEADEASWMSNLTYGLGLRCDNLDGSDCTGSQNSDFYQQFPNLSGLEKPQAVMQGRASQSAKKGQITFKLNVPGTQKPGSYSNSITFIAIPNY